MKVETLIPMANQIGEFFQAMPDRDEGLDGFTQHIRLFWAPPMRQALTDHFEKTGGDGLLPIAIDALRKNSILPKPAPVAPTDPHEPVRNRGWEGDTES